MKERLILLLLGVLLGRLYAVPANPNPVEKTQPDGTKITVHLKGDEFIHWMESPSGYTLMYNNNREVVFGVHDNKGNLTPSAIIYRGDNLKEYSSSAREQIEKTPTKLRYSEEQKTGMRQLMRVVDKSKQKAEEIKTPKDVSGTHKVLVILAGFADRPFTKSNADFEDLMNQISYTGNGNTGSVRDFYRENSYGKMDVEATVAGPVTLSKNTYDYAKGGIGYYEFAKEVATLADSIVNFADYATDGFVPNFHIIFAGYGDESIDNGQQIWSHKWSFVQMNEDSTLSYDIREFDSVEVGWSYSCSPELRGDMGDDMSYIGVICHELGHGFGAPDYYDTDYEENGQYWGTGRYDLMANGSWSGGGASPSHINMFQKIAFGWVVPTELNFTISIKNMPASADSAVAYWIKVNNNGERYVLENRQQKKFDSYIPGHGLLIYHVHKDALAGDLSNGNKLNAAHPQKTYIVASSSFNAIPDSNPYSYGYINEYDAAPFPGYYGKTSFDGTTTPAMFSWSINGEGGTTVKGKKIRNIKENAENGTVSFYFSNTSASSEQPVISIADAGSTLRLYPNPAKTELTINWIAGIGSSSGASCGDFEIYNLLGTIVMKGSLSAGSISEAGSKTINISSLPAGIYVVKVGDYKTKFIKK